MAKESVSVETNFQGVARALERQGKKVTQSRAEKFALKVVQEAQDIANEKFSDDDDRDDERAPDRYVDSFYYSAEPTGRGVKVNIANSHHAANIIEHGSVAHEIAPRSGGRLTWEPNTMLPVDYAVWHPGTVGVAAPIRTAIKRVRARQSSTKLR